MENTKKVLLFHVSEEKTKQIRALCSKMQIAVVTVKDSLWGQSLGSLAGIKGLSSPAASAAPFSSPIPSAAPFSSPIPSAAPLSSPALSMEMMVFSGIPSGELDAFLASYHEAGIPMIPLKAILTPYNIFWNATQLYQELQKEHSQLQK